MPVRDFEQIQWDSAMIDDCRQLIRLAVREDLGRQHDWTTLATTTETSRGEAVFASRADGTVAGLRAAELVADEMNLDAEWAPLVADGDAIRAGQELAVIRGAARDLLTSERLMLNLLGRLSGIASLTRRCVTAAAAGGKAGVYDTRKTTPGWRRLEKHAVRCGGGRNHRLGLCDAVLIKDNHLQQLRDQRPDLSLADAVRHARDFAHQQTGRALLVELEVDTLDQLREALPGEPDIVLLDNMSLEQLREAVAIRESEAPQLQLEASGGVSLSTIESIASTGVDRISVGALTHSAVSLDIGLDWRAA